MTRVVSIAPHAQELIRDRKPFTESNLTGYYTRGGTYILATPAAWTDDGKAHDLVAIIPNPFSAEHPVDVEELRCTVSPEFVDEVRRIVR